LDSIYAGVTHVKLNRQSPEIWHALSDKSHKTTQKFGLISFTSGVWFGQIKYENWSPQRALHNGGTKLTIWIFSNFGLVCRVCPSKFVNFDYQHMHLCFFFESLPTKKNIAIEQNCLSAMKIEFINHIFRSKGDYLIYRPPLTLFSYKLKLHV
jgi:hypothetical protein